MSTKGMFRGLATLGGILLLAAPSLAQRAQGDAERSSSNDEHLASLIERLEVGMSALEELERRDALEVVRRIASELRAERSRTRRESSREESDEIQTVRRRLRVMRTAVDAFREAGRRDAAGRVEHAMHARELSIEGRRDAEANHTRETAPDRAQLAELLGAAAGFYEGWGMPDQAQALGQLAETYAKQWQRQQDATRAGQSAERKPERPPTGDIEDLNHRIEIIRFAREAMERAGREDAAHTMERFLHVAELQREDAGGTAIGQAFEGLTFDTIIELLQRASRLYWEWGWEGRSALCLRLAEYYRTRDQGSGGGGSVDIIEPREPDAALRGRLAQLLERTEALQQELVDIRRSIHQLLDR